MYKENMYVHKECWDLHREGGPLSVDKQTNENKRKKFVYVWILTKMFWICTRKIEYVHKRIGTYTVREAHWFKSSFTGNNAPFNTNGIQYTQMKRKRMIEVYLCLSKKVSVLCTDKNCMCLERVWYVQRNIMYIK